MTERHYRRKIYFPLRISADLNDLVNTFSPLFSCKTECLEAMVTSFKNSEEMFVWIQKLSRLQRHLLTMEQETNRMEPPE